MKDTSPLKYKDDSDRAYGLAGMAIAMMLWDGETYLASVSMDAPVGQSIEFTPAFGFTSNPRLSASLAWRENIKQFELSAAMIMANTICRQFVQHSQPLSRNASVALKEYLRNEGHETCALDDDEIDIIYNKTDRYLNRVFAHSGVSAVAHDFVTQLLQRRKLSSGEVLEILSILNRL